MLFQMNHAVWIFFIWTILMQFSSIDSTYIWARSSFELRKLEGSFSGQTFLKYPWELYVRNLATNLCKVWGITQN